MHIRITPRLFIGRSLWARLWAFGLIALLGGCAQLPTPADARSSAQLPDDIEIDVVDVEPEIIPEPQEEPEPGKLYEWNSSGRPISRVVIDTNAQQARFYDGQEQVGWTTIASGVSAHPTPSGEFEVIEKVAKKRSNLYGRIYNASGGLHKRNAHSSDPIPAGGKFVGARMPHFMRMTYDGIGMHAGAIPQPGQPASHGCIRLPDEVASSLFAHADIGTRVTVIGSGPDYGDYAERIRRQRAQERRNRVAKAETQSESRSESEPQSESQSEARAATQAEGNDGLSDPESQSGSQAEVQAGAQPEAQPESESQLQPQPEPLRTNDASATVEEPDSATVTPEPQQPGPRQAPEERVPTAPSPAQESASDASEPSPTRAQPTDPAGEVSD